MYCSEFKETMNSLDSRKPWTTKLSSAGLVYAFFGRKVIETLSGRRSSGSSYCSLSCSSGSSSGSNVILFLVVVVVVG